MRKTLIFLILLVFSLASCMTSYEPRPSPRLTMVMEAGNPLLVRNGQRYHLGLFGGELEEAVAPNAAAMDHAQAFRNQLLGGFLLGVASAAPIGIGAGMFANASVQRTDTTIPLAVLIGGLITYSVGLGLMFSAQPHMYDAINVYNDWVDQGMPADATLTQ